MKKRALGTILGGTVGGALGTTFMQKSMQHSDEMPEALQPPPIEQDPGEFMVDRFEERLGRPLPNRTRRRAARSLHWLYGTSWAAALGALAPRLGMSRLGRAATAGALMGAAVWATGYGGWLPRTGLTPPLREQGVGASVGALGTHIAYGVLASLPIYAASKLLEKR